MAISGQPHIGKAAIKAFRCQIEYPVRSLDFETISTAILLLAPGAALWPGAGENVVGSPASRPEHHLFLADGRADPPPP